MSNFKSGSGNLDFGGDDEDEEAAESTGETAQTQTEKTGDDGSASSEKPISASSNRASSDTESTSTRSVPDQTSAAESTASDPAAEKYPYFVRRRNVGDERDTRLEIHVRDKVANREATFRNELAERLEVNEVSKTDAREFALLAAFHNPEQVAELMRDEGFGTLG